MRLCLALAALLVALICRLFPDKIAANSIKPNRTPISDAERRLALLLGATLARWLTEGLHGIAPAWIGLAAAVVCLLPGIGMLPPDTFNAINHRKQHYVAELLGVVAVLSDTGLGDELARLVLPWLPLHHDAEAWNFGWLTLLSFAMSLIASANGVGAIYSAFAADLVIATGLPLLSVLMIL